MRLTKFQKRLVTGIALAVIGIPSIILFEGVVFKTLITIVTVAAILTELLPLYRKARKIGWTNLITTEQRGLEPPLEILDLGTSTFIVGFIFLIGEAVFVDIVWHEVFFVIIVAFGYDIFAYLIGKKYGGTRSSGKPFPNFSPGKTLEGTLGGLLMSVTLGASYVAILDSFGVEIPFVPAIFSIIFGSTFACLGDLLGSNLKRRAGVKDSGNRITVKIHGGLIDRFTSLYFTAILYGTLRLFS